MGKITGRSSERRLVDMSSEPDGPVPSFYTPPPLEICDEEPSYPIELTDSDRLHIRMRLYGGKVVEFAIMQMTRRRGQWHEVFRVDCCHGWIHSHRFTQGGEEKTIRITEIPRANDHEAWDVIGAGYDKAHEQIIENWEAHLEHWRTT